MLGRGTVTTIMRMNRRNVLVGLGTIVAGGGAALGTGAFSSVEADRTVSVETAGDGSAFLQLSGDGEYITNDNSGELTLNLGQVNNGDGFNENAKTVVNDIVTVTNNAADGEDITVGFNDGGTPPEASATVNLDDSNGAALADITFYFGSENSQSTETIGSNSSSTETTMGVIVDTRNPTGGDGESAAITIYAEDADGS